MSVAEAMPLSERQRLVEERSELRQSLRGLDDQRAALVRRLARLERELAVLADKEAAQ